uniref:Uncharacterized protein n=1 Tax=Candidatus Kentrum sp. FW TaxID=2126338 RepID=A0A450TMU9_9GAMM|nr:MAG: hypothetical protein BECKFW1821C_GA0114237_101732 [Candidatus Kentron sp. FW]
MMSGFFEPPYEHTKTRVRPFLLEKFINKLRLFGFHEKQLLAIDTIPRNGVLTLRRN